MKTFGFQRSWNGSSGPYSLKVGGFATAEEAQRVWEREAGAFGYTPARWWQFWRWGENHSRF